MYLNKTLIMLLPVDCVTASETRWPDVLPGVLLVNKFFLVVLDKVCATLPITESQT